MQCMAKTEVYSWRLSPDLKSELEEAARTASKNVAQLLEEMAADWLANQRAAQRPQDPHQASLREAAMKSVGAIRGDDPDRAENARSSVRARLARRHGR